MAGTPVNKGTGTTIVFATTGFTSELLNLDLGGTSRESIETTHMGTPVSSAPGFGSRTYIPGCLSDPGEITLELHLDPDKTPPIDAEPETVTITFPLVSGDTTSPIWNATAFCNGADAAVPLEDKMTQTITLKVSGKITITPAT